MTTTLQGREQNEDMINCPGETGHKLLDMMTKPRYIVFRRKGLFSKARTYTPLPMELAVVIDRWDKINVSSARVEIRRRYEERKREIDR